MNSDVQKGNKKKLITLKQGQSFGIYGFFTGVEKIVNAYSNKFSTIIKIDRKKMLEILKDNPRDYEKFMEVKDKIYFDENYKDLNLNCFICNSQEHLFEKCDRTHFNKQNPIIYFKLNYSIDQKRSTAIRKQQKKQNIKLSLDEHFNAIDKLREEYHLDEDEDEDDDDDDDYIDEDDEDEYLEEDGQSIQENISMREMQKSDDKDHNKQDKNDHQPNTNNGNNVLFVDNNDDEEQEKNSPLNDSDVDNIEKDQQNQRSPQESMSSSQDLNSINRPDDIKTPDNEHNLEMKKKKSLHYLNKKQEGTDLNEKLKSQENVNRKSRSSLRNDISSLEYEENIQQKKVVKIKTSNSKRRQSQSQQRTLQSLEKSSTIQEDLPQQHPSGFIQTSKLSPFQINTNNMVEIDQQPQQNRRQSVQQKVRYDKNLAKTMKRMSVRQQNRFSISRNATLGNGLNQQILFKKIGSQFQPIAQNPENEIPLYWRMESQKNYLVYYPEYNSQEVIKRLQLYQMRKYRKNLKQKKFGHSSQITGINFSRLKTNQFQSFRGNPVPSTIQQKPRNSQFDSEIEKKS